MKVNPISIIACVFIFVCPITIALAQNNSTRSDNVLSMTSENDDENEETGLVDDWHYQTRVPGGHIGGTLSHSKQSYASALLGSVQSRVQTRNMHTRGILKVASIQSLGNIGFSVGGAKDTANFRQNLENGFLPKYNSITYEGKFYDYYFDTGIGTQACQELFCPSFAKAISSDLYSGEKNYYLSIGLNSILTEKSFERKKLNLVVVLDISGSMGSPFDRYSYDPSSKDENQEEHQRTKMELANRAIVDMMDHLSPEDRFAVVLFDDQSYTAKPMRLVARTDMKAIAGHILDVTDQGGTNWEAGYTTGLNLFAGLPSAVKDNTVYENRIIFITDAMPNSGNLAEDSLLAMIRKGADSGIFTSFIGVGVDFNVDLVENMSKIRGANYFSIQNPTEFKKRLADEFDFMVTPLVFDLELSLHSSNFSIEGVYGSPEADLADGTVMYINTLFPSATEDEKVRGGVILVKLKKTGPGNSPVSLDLHFKDRSGTEHSVQARALFPADAEAGTYDNIGIRKAILLSEYVSLIKNWLLDTRRGCNDKVETGKQFPVPKSALANPDIRPERSMVSTWERKSCPLAVSGGYQKFFTLFNKHFRQEMKSIRDDTLKQELQVLKQLATPRQNTVKQDGQIDDWR